MYPIPACIVQAVLPAFLGLHLGCAQVQHTHEASGLAAARDPMKGRANRRDRKPPNLYLTPWTTATAVDHETGLEVDLEVMRSEFVKALEETGYFARVRDLKTGESTPTSGVVIQMSVTGARLTRRRDAAFFWNQVAWPVLGPLAGWVHDQRFELEVAVDLRWRTAPPHDGLDQHGDRHCMRAADDLNLGERSDSRLAGLLFALPPGLMPTSDRSVTRSLAARAVQPVVAALIDRLDRRPVSSQEVLGEIGADLPRDSRGRTRIPLLVPLKTEKDLDVWH